jgi:hypothetical protein
VLTGVGRRRGGLRKEGSKRRRLLQFLAVGGSWLGDVACRCVKEEARRVAVVHLWLHCLPVAAAASGVGARDGAERERVSEWAEAAERRGLRG